MIRHSDLEGRAQRPTSTSESYSNTSRPVCRLLRLEVVRTRCGSSRRSPCRSTHATPVQTRAHARSSTRLRHSPQNIVDVLEVILDWIDVPQLNASVPPSALNSGFSSSALNC